MLLGRLLMSKAWLMLDATDEAVDSSDVAENSVVADRLGEATGLYFSAWELVGSTKLEEDDSGDFDVKEAREEDEVEDDDEKVVRMR
jgi:hypothetical protein